MRWLRTPSSTGSPGAASSERRFLGSACHAQDISRAIIFPSVRFRFIPAGGCAEAVARKRDAAEIGAIVPAYPFTTAPTAQAFGRSALPGKTGSTGRCPPCKGNCREPRS